MSARSAVGLAKMSACTKKSSEASASRPRALSPCAIARVGVLLQAAPAVERNRARGPQRAGGLHDGVGGNTGDRLGRLGCHRRAVPAQMLQHRTAANRPVGRGYLHDAREREPRRLDALRPRGRVVAEGCAVRLVPRHVPHPGAFRHFCSAQQLAGVGPYEERSVGPATHEGLVVPAPFEHHVGQPERQRRIRTGPDLQPVVGPAGPRSHSAPRSTERPTRTRRPPPHSRRRSARAWTRRCPAPRPS
jgi:hypothetical protein